MTHGMVSGLPWPRKLLCAASWRFASAESHRCAQQGSCADFFSHSSLLLGPLWVQQRWGICPGVEWLGKDGNWLLSSSESFWSLGQRNGGLLAFYDGEPKQIHSHLLLPSINSGIMRISWVQGWEPGCGMLLGLHVTVCTMLMPNLSGLWIY